MSCCGPAISLGMDSKAQLEKHAGCKRSVRAEAAGVSWALSEEP